LFRYSFAGDRVGGPKDPQHGQGPCKWSAHPRAPANGKHLLTLCAEFHPTARGGNSGGRKLCNVRISRKPGNSRTASNQSSCLELLESERGGGGGKKGNPGGSLGGTNQLHNRGIQMSGCCYRWIQCACVCACVRLATFITKQLMSGFSVLNVRKRL
jgi:hypothetical protein